jgi:hypothetical protein
MTAASAAGGARGRTERERAWRTLCEKALFVDDSERIDEEHGRFDEIVERKLRESFTDA